jgi:hypothetical protein
MHRPGSETGTVRIGCDRLLSVVGIQKPSPLGRLRETGYLLDGQKISVNVYCDQMVGSVRLDQFLQSIYTTMVMKVLRAILGFPCCHIASL